MSLYLATQNASNYLSTAINPTINAAASPFLTIACWWKPLDNIENTCPMLIGETDTDNNRLSPYARTQSADVRLRVWAGVGLRALTTPTHAAIVDWFPFVAHCTNDGAADAVSAWGAGQTYSGTANSITTDMPVDKLWIGNGIYAGCGRIAHVCVWQGQLIQADVDAFLAGDNPPTINSANLLYYFPLTTETGATTNQGTAGGTLTVNGTVAWDDADNPTITASGGPTPPYVSVSIS